VRGVVILALDPCSEGAIHGVERHEIFGAKKREQLHASRPEPALHLALALWHVGPGVDEGDAELGADDGELLGAERRSIIDVQPLRDAAPAHGLLEHGKVGDGPLGERERRVRHHPRRIVDEGNEVGLPRAAGVADLRSVHHVAHPQLASAVVFEAAPILARRLLGLLAHEPAAREQAVHGRFRQRNLLGRDAPVIRARLLDQHRDRQLGVFLLQVAEQVGQLGRDGTRCAVVGACTWHEGVDPAATIITEPASDRLGRDAAA
jgi:hypothetical protein